MFVSIFAITVQTFFVHIFNDRNVGYAYYALVAMIVILNRLVREGRIPPSKEKVTDRGVAVPTEKVWVE